MVVDNVLHMNCGDGENSYARNSLFQEKVIAKARPILEETIKTHYSNNSHAFQKCFTMADFGCSSGPNTFLVVDKVLDTVTAMPREKGRQPWPDEFQVFLNDLPGNDFNAIFKSLPAFYEKLEKRRELVSCYISGIPGSFYTRLFPSNTLHFAHASYSVHWLSQVPKGIENNKGNIYMAKTSQRNVFEAYLHQFEIDFSRFLCCRGEEIIHGGQMVLTIAGRSIADPTSKDCCYMWELLSKSLHDMAAEGLVQEVDIDSFNMPYYTPCSEEVRAIVEKEGSFKLNKSETFELNWDPYDDDYEALFVAPDKKKRSGENAACLVRAYMEPMLASQFGETVMDNLFDRFAEYMAEHLSVEKTKEPFIVVSLTKLK